MENKENRENSKEEKIEREIQKKKYTTRDTFLLFFYPK